MKKKLSTLLLSVLVFGILSIQVSGLISHNGNNIVYTPNELTDPHRSN